MEDLLSIFKITKIDFSKVIIKNNSERSSVEHFDLKPRDFIRYAKDDLNNNDKKGFVNSLTNSKRAIDCQIDTIFYNYGISFDKIPSASEKLIESLNVNNDLPHKLKMIQALKFSPSNLTTKTRNFRNRLEHYYQIPNEKEIRESLEIAELFIQSCESKIKWVEDDFIITNESFGYLYPHPFAPVENSHIGYLQMTLYKNNVSITFDNENKYFKITPTIDKMENEAIVYSQDNPEFYFLIRILNSKDDQIDLNESFALLLKYKDYPLPQKNINIENWY
ncbi:hypothetical protein [Halpernia frigidisoli]|uniref:Uncharacterized protein n=1 Tax=Halpernia frigidisoli TaxID=1125876 RepID=A0A1I3FK15_9FLAO|nr:hypothetical protein [Halpernia frigidisoli]SFI11598.1 hypothetical protein SAMN05443292_1433 [Halpernia frigidisoli]